MRTGVCVVARARLTMIGCSGAWASGACEAFLDRSKQAILARLVPAHLSISAQWAPSLIYRSSPAPGVPTEIHSLPCHQRAKEKDLVSPDKLAAKVRVLAFTLGR